MAIARIDSPRRRPARPARWATATLLAASLVAGLVGPALAAGGGPAGPDTAGARRAAQRGDATVGRDPRTVPGVPTAADAVAATPSPAPDPTPAAAPAADPGATPTPAPAADPVPTATPVPTPTPWPTPAWPTTVTTLGASVRFYGHGYGHGVGMSQSGAKGRAAAGQSAPQILAAYFKGAQLSTVDATRVVRVLVLTAFPAPSTAPLVIVGRGGTWTVDGSGKTFPADARLRAWRTSKAVDGVATTTWHGKVLAPDGKTALWSATLKGRPIVRPLEAASSLQLASRTSSYDTYRGLFRLLLYAGSASVVNHVGLDQYLRGVVPAEMPSTWPTEALRAQVIACRSYAYNDLSATSTTFDTYDDTRSQVYRGIEGERAATDALIAAEPGAVIRYGTGVITAYYFSTGGGATENNEFAFVTSAGKPGSSKVPYLRGIVDRNQFGIPFDATATYYRWSTSALTRARLSAMFGKDSRTKVGTLTRLDLRRRGVSGRLYQVVLYGSGGTKTVSANVFRAVYNANRPAGTAMLRSNLFDTKPIP